MKNSNSIQLATAAIVCIFCGSLAAHAQGNEPLHITHQYADLDARSMIGLPMGSHKTIVTQDGQLQWSQWSLANKGRAVLFGFSDQMDGALGIQLSELDATGEKPLVAAGQHLVENRFPFPVTNWKGEQLNAEETAFAASVGETGLDVVEITVTNPGGEPRTLELRLNGKQRNLPAFSNGAELSTRDGNLLAVVEPESGVLKATAENDGMTLVEQRVVP
ncbi:MAG: hypothetical protein WB567_17315, partial [Terracidiphilus sp.]